MAEKILLLFAHPALEKSRVHRRLAGAVRRIPGITFHDLYEQYPDFDIEVEYEKQLLTDHSIIIWQHPFYWYSAPAIIKQWMDLVLEHGWAYGAGGTALTGKKIMNCISCGGSREVYSRTGRNRYTIRELLTPFEQTARLCHMQYLPPFVVHGTHRLKDEDIMVYANLYQEAVLALFENRFDNRDLERAEYLNDAPVLSKQA
jgi:glutathione-regulated potassium-efflux system ancillary protein KefG